MKCQKCVDAGLKSHVNVSATSSTCMGFSPFFDEDGVYHNHDGNYYSEAYMCSNGHRWHHSWQSKCPAPDCGWNTTRKDTIIWNTDVSMSGT